MAKKTTSGTTGRSTQSTTGRGEQETGAAAQEISQPKGWEVVEQPGTRRPRQPAGPTHEQIAQRAQEIWRRHGSPPGEDRENWFEAEVELKREMSIP